MRFSLKSYKPVSFKKRYSSGYTFNNLRYGNLGLKFLKSYNIEHIYMLELKKKLKFFLNLKKKIFNRNLWIFFKSNLPISKKSKNSRMGKGKGSFLRLSCRIKKNTIFLEFLNLNYLILNKIILLFKKKNCLKIKVLKKNNINIFFKKHNICYYNVYNQF